MNAFRQFLTFVGSQYEKLITAVVLIALIASGVYVGIKLGTQGAEQTAFERRIALVPKHPHAEVAVIAPYEQAESALKERPVVAAWSNALFVPETRCACVECRLPIPLSADVCPLCGEDQTDSAPPEDLDSDLDGIPDLWEKKHGLDARDPSDGPEDQDRDGWSNLEEFKFDTDPNDSSSHPDDIGKLRVVRIQARPFHLLFDSILKSSRGLKFGVNTRSGKTYFKRLGEEVEGFELHSYKTNWVEEAIGLSGITVRRDRSILTLKQGKKLVPLVYGKRITYQEYRADLVFLINDKRYAVKQGDKITVKGVGYKVIKIDIEKQSVVIGRLGGVKKLYVIGRDP